jgi:hypothetical protein
LGRAARQMLVMSSSQALVRIAPGCHTKKAMWTARPSSCSTEHAVATQWYLLQAVHQFDG